jgi:hypothetical protein
MGSRPKEMSMKEVNIATKDDLTPELQAKLEAHRAEAKAKYGESFYEILNIAIGLDEMNESLALAYGRTPHAAVVSGLSINVITDTLNKLIELHNAAHNTSYTPEDVNEYMVRTEQLKREFTAAETVPMMPTPGSYYIN